MEQRISSFPFSTLVRSLFRLIWESSRIKFSFSSSFMWFGCQLICVIAQQCWIGWISFLLWNSSNRVSFFSPVTNFIVPLVIDLIWRFDCIIDSFFFVVLFVWSYASFLCLIFFNQTVLLLHQSSQFNSLAMQMDSMLFS